MEGQAELLKYGVSLLRKKCALEQRAIGNERDSVLEETAALTADTANGLAELLLMAIPPETSGADENVRAMLSMLTAALKDGDGLVTDSLRHSLRNVGPWRALEEKQQVLGDKCREAFEKSVEQERRLAALLSTGELSTVEQVEEYIENL